MQLYDPLRLYVWWPILAILLAILREGVAVKRSVVRMGLALTPAGAIIGAIWGHTSPVGMDSRYKYPLEGVGAVMYFVLDGCVIWCAIAAILAAPRFASSRARLALAAVVGGLVGVFVGVVLALSAECSAKIGGCL